MNELDLPPFSDFGSFPMEKLQTLRLDFVTEGEATIVNVSCKTERECSSLDGPNIDETCSSIALDRLVFHVQSLKLRKTAKLSIAVMEMRTEWKQKIVFALRKLFFFISVLPIVHLEVGASEWSIFSELRIDFYSTFKNIHELVFLPDPEMDLNKMENVDVHHTLLFEWLPRIKSTLRCLRIFPFLKVDADMEEVMKDCKKLKTLTIGKLYSYRDCPEFYSIRYLDLDGQGMAYSSDELSLIRRLRSVFPNTRVFRVVRHSREILKALLQTVIKAGGVFDIYSDMWEMELLLHIVGDTLVMEVVEEHPDMEDAYVEMVGRNERYKTTIHFYNHRQRRYIE